VIVVGAKNRSEITDEATRPRINVQITSGIDPGETGDGIIHGRITILDSNTGSKWYLDEDMAFADDGSFVIGGTVLLEGINYYLIERLGGGGEISGRIVLDLPAYAGPFEVGDTYVMPNGVSGIVKELNTEFGVKVAFCGIFDLDEFPGWNITGYSTNVPYYSKIKSRVFYDKYWTDNFYDAKYFIMASGGDADSELTVCSVFTIIPFGGVNKIVVNSFLMPAPFGITYSSLSANNADIWPSNSSLAIGDNVVFSGGKLWRVNHGDYPDIRISSGTFYFGTLRSFTQYSTYVSFVISENELMHIKTNEPYIREKCRFQFNGLITQKFQQSITTSVYNDSHAAVVFSGDDPYMLAENDDVEEIVKGIGLYDISHICLCIEGDTSNTARILKENEFTVINYESQYGGLLALERSIGCSDILVYGTQGNYQRLAFGIVKGPKVKETVNQKKYSQVFSIPASSAGSVNFRVIKPGYITGYSVSISVLNATTTSALGPGSHTHPANITLLSTINIADFSSLPTSDPGSANYGSYSVWRTTSGGTVTVYVKNFPAASVTTLAFARSPCPFYT
jgi:hypothetical protein